MPDCRSATIRLSDNQSGSKKSLRALVIDTITASLPAAASKLNCRPVHRLIAANGSSRSTTSSGAATNFASVINLKDGDTVTRILSPADGYVTNLLAQLGDYVNVGVNTISVVDANSFWVDAYFEETNHAPIRVGDRAQIKLMGYTQTVRGHVDSIARAINVSNAQPNSQGVATVNPIFTWVRLAQRIPVRVHIDKVPPGVVLAAGMTATVDIEDRASAPTE
jgi:multidrug resistance efflux pump